MTHWLIHSSDVCHFVIKGDLISTSSYSYKRICNDSNLKEHKIGDFYTLVYNIKQSMTKLNNE